MPRWGRPPGARMGRHSRGRAAWEEMTRVEEVESTDEEEYLREMARNGRAPYMRQLEYGARGPRRRPADYEDVTDGTESVDGGDYDLYDHDDSTVAYAVQLAMRDKEDQLVEKALERIRRAQVLGKKNVRLSQRELDALERKRLQTDGVSGSRRSQPPGNSDNNKVGRSASRRTASGAPPEHLIGPYPPFPPGSHRTGAAHDRPTTSSSAPRPRTPTAHSLRPQHSSSPLRPSYSPYPVDRFPPTNRPQSMPQPPSVFARPLPDDPQWAPPYYNPVPMDPYAAEQPAYQPPMPRDLRAGSHSRMSYPSGLPPFPAYHQRQSLDGRTRAGPAPSESESDSGSSEDEEEEEETDSEGDDDGVQIVQVEEKRPSPRGVQRRVVSGSRRGRGGRAGR